MCFPTLSAMLRYVLLHFVMVCRAGRPDGGRRCEVAGGRGGGGVREGRPVGRVNSIPAMHNPAASQTI